MVPAFPCPNSPPTANAGGPYSGNFGLDIAMSGATASDPDMDPLTYSWTVNSASCSFNDASVLNPNLTCNDTGNFTATLEVDDGVNPPVSSDAAVMVNKADQTITFSSLADKTFGDAAFNVSASADSGLPVSFAAVGFCTVSAGTVTITGAGLCTITASQAGNDDYNAASDVSQTFMIDKATSTVTVTCTAGAPYTYTGAAQTPCTATASGVGMTDVDVTASIVYGSNTNAGLATADASWDGDANHTGNTGSGGFTIGKAASTTVVTFESGPYVFRGSAFTATAQVTGVGGLNEAVTVTYSGNCVFVSVPNGCSASATYAGDENHTGSSDSQSITILSGCSMFDGFKSPIGGAVENGNGGSSMNPVKKFKLGSTIPVKFSATCFGAPLTTGVHVLEALQWSTVTSMLGDPIDATPTDAATTGGEFRLTDTQWHYNLDTKNTPGFSSGTWLLRATLYDGSSYSVWIEIKK